MVPETVRSKLKIAATVAFWIAAIVGWWSVIEEGPTLMNMLPAVCMTLAGTIWLIMVLSPPEHMR